MPERDRPGEDDFDDDLMALLSRVDSLAEAHPPDELVVLTKEELQRREFQAYAAGWQDAEEARLEEADQQRSPDTVTPSAAASARSRMRLVPPDAAPADVLTFPMDRVNTPPPATASPPPSSSPGTAVTSATAAASEPNGEAGRAPAAKSPGTSRQVSEEQGPELVLDAKPATSRAPDIPPLRHGPGLRSRARAAPAEPVEPVEPEPGPLSATGLPGLPTTPELPGPRPLAPARPHQPQQAVRGAHDPYDPYDPYDPDSSEGQREGR
ncbi:hypothetical protein LHJ74_22895 [Streptomyces sp. N2-109]|uniref:Uncharacterized protein n=1 Tax=Streptomyces gossypii TaxID=2883101 RepID=A0ABT2JXU8_9ACTN|nr:hypothetical protein [Streptomyces gossypii]MCT2592725.1 hypothetical protein [Streptomyces gossypii]